MAAGSWGCGPVTSDHPPFGPTHMSAYPKQQLGWADFLDVGQVHHQEYDLEPMETSGRALRIPLDGSGSEYLLMEYRKRIGFDADLPTDGVMIYHEDDGGELHPAPGSGNPHLLSVIEQDHDHGLMRDSAQGGDRGEAGDAWGVGGIAEKLDYVTTPSLALSGGGPTPVTIHSVAAEGDRAVVWLSSAPTPVIMAPADSTPVTPGSAFQRHFLVSGGYMPYTFGGALPVGVAATANGDDLLLSGSVSAAGAAAGLRVIDARGSVSPVLFYPLVTGSPTLSADQLLQPLLRSGGTAPTAADEEYLDASGNANGAYDVGDLRAWLRAHPSAGG
jgi:hypothetical protein